MVMNFVYPINGLYAGPFSFAPGDSTLGDIVAEVFLLSVPVIVFGSNLIGKWAVDYGFAFLLELSFNTIKPMKNLPPGNAQKASWQLGMYGNLYLFNISSRLRGE